MATAGDDDSWLRRLPAGDWMRAALGELEKSYVALAGKRYREGLSHARRAAGMALNAELCVAPAPQYGRSYMEHLAALATDAACAAPARAAAQLLHDAPAVQQLVTLGPGSTALADAARQVLVHVAERLPADVT